MVRKVVCKRRQFRLSDIGFGSSDCRRPKLIYLAAIRVLLAKRNAELHAHAAVLATNKFKAVGGSIELAQTRSGIRQTDSFFDFLRRAKAGPIVTYDQRQS